MSQNEYDAAVAEFMRTKGITRCPAACAVPTHTDLPTADRVALRNYSDAKEAARMERARSYQPFAA